VPKFGDRFHLCFTDTDSFICHIESEDLVSELHEISEWLDTSNFESKHPLYSKVNFRTLGKFKSETGSIPPIEFCGLRSKMYSCDTNWCEIVSESKGSAEGVRAKKRETRRVHARFEPLDKDVMQISQISFQSSSRDDTKTDKSLSLVC